MITALILAAGRSRRMGRPKLPLAWGNTTVLGHIIDVIKTAGVREVLVVTGGDRNIVESIARECGASTVFNPQHEDREMLGSLQAGIQALGEDVQAVLVALGDQPQILEGTVRSILGEYEHHSSKLIVPSYHMHRGHPWLVQRELWPAILALEAPQTPREFLAAHAADIHYLNVDTPTVLEDLDTPQDYLKSAL